MKGTSPFRGIEYIFISYDDPIDVIEFLKNIDGTLILYEAPHRINKTLKDMGNILGNNRKISISREITKKYEEASSDSVDIDLSVDHLARFIECCKANIEDTALLDEEISEVCK